MKLIKRESFISVIAVDFFYLAKMRMKIKKY